MGKPLSSLYMYLTVAHDTDTSTTLIKWREDIPNLDEDIWEDSVSVYIPSMITSRDRFIQLKFLHRAYYTPQRLANIYPSLSPMCTRCSFERGSFLHMVWTCQNIRPYWQRYVVPHCHWIPSSFHLVILVKWRGTDTLSCA